MSKTPKRTAEEVVQAVRGSGGILSHIANKLGVSRPTLWAYVKKWPEVAQAIEDERESVLDLGETELIKAVKRQESWAICFLLKCQGKKRGWVEKQQMDHSSSDGTMTPPQRIEIVPASFDEQDPDSTS